MTRTQRKMSDDPADYWNSRRSHWMRKIFLCYEDWLLMKIFGEAKKEALADARESVRESEAQISNSRRS